RGSRGNRERGWSVREQDQHHARGEGHEERDLVDPASETGLGRCDDGDQDPSSYPGGMGYPASMTSDLVPRIAVPRGDEPADLLLSGGLVLSVFTGEFLEADVAIVGQHVAGVGA